MKKNKKIKINWGDEVVLPNGQIVQPKMLTPDESRVLNTRFMPAWQREFKDTKRNAYQAQMAARMWDNANLSVIRLTKDGEVCDGGHRTSAAALANFTLAALLIKNVPAKIFLTTDIHKTRGCGVFISGVDKNTLGTFAQLFLRANLGLSAFSQGGRANGITFAYNNNDPAAFLHANREEIESYVKIASCMRSRSKNTVPSRVWAAVAAIARLKSGSDAWVYSLKNDSPCIIDIKDYQREAENKHVTADMQRIWMCCRLLSDFREKTFRGKKWNTRQIAQITDEFSHALKGHFKTPTADDYRGAADDLFKYAKEAAVRKAAKEAASC